VNAASLRRKRSPGSIAAALLICAVLTMTPGGASMAQGEPDLGEVPAASPVQRLEDVQVIGHGDYFFKLDQRLRNLRDSLPCVGCEGRLLTGPPLAVRLGLEVATFALKPFFQQPRVRGEPNDEAHYLAMRSANCFGDLDTSRCPNTYPNPGMVNWAADPAGDVSQFEFPLVSK